MGWLQGYRGRYRIDVTNNDPSFNSQHFGIRILTYNGVGGPVASTDFFAKADVFLPIPSGDPCDIAVTDSDGVTPLSALGNRYRLPGQTEFITVAILGSVPAGSTKTIYVYYDSGAASPQCPNNPSGFEYFYDFDTVPPWEKIGAVVVTASNSRLYVTEGGGVFYQPTSTVPVRGVIASGQITTNYYYYWFSMAAGRPSEDELNLFITVEFRKAGSLRGIIITRRHTGAIFNLDAHYETDLSIGFDYEFVWVLVEGRGMALSFQNNATLKYELLTTNTPTYKNRFVGIFNYDNYAYHDYLATFLMPSQYPTIRISGPEAQPIALVENLGVDTLAGSGLMHSVDGTVGVGDPSPLSTVRLLHTLFSSGSVAGHPGFEQLSPVLSGLAVGDKSTTSTSSRLLLSARLVETLSALQTTLLSSGLAPGDSATRSKQMPRSSPLSGSDEVATSIDERVWGAVLAREAGALIASLSRLLGAGATGFLALGQAAPVQVSIGVGVSDSLLYGAASRRIEALRLAERGAGGLAVVAGELASLSESLSLGVGERLVDTLSALESRKLASSIQGLDMEYVRDVLASRGKAPILHRDWLGVFKGTRKRYRLP